MTIRSERRMVAGPAGRIEVVLDWPDRDSPVGVAHIAHPHPLYGGSLDNKVVSTLARVFATLGWLAVRSNFRGVGATEGQHDDGRGELDDLLHLIGDIPWLPDAGARKLALAGFSFGSFVVARAAEQLQERGSPVRHVILVGAAAGKWPMPGVDPGALVVHGELDETIPLPDVFTWARGCGVPVVVVPGGEHFFHGRLPILKKVVARHLLGAEAESQGAAPI
ncbi:MAG TPA: alpha/beta fold hydrolase [Burkholderiaceae bacterium]